MLGITTPDAIAFGSVCAALLAAFAGLVKGDQAKKDSPPDPAMAMIGWGLLNREALRDLTGAVTDLVDALRAGTLHIDPVRARAIALASLDEDPPSTALDAVQVEVNGNRITVTLRDHVRFSLLGIFMGGEHFDIEVHASAEPPERSGATARGLVSAVYSFARVTEAGPGKKSRRNTCNAFRRRPTAGWRWRSLLPTPNASTASSNQPIAPFLFPMTAARLGQSAIRVTGWSGVPSILPTCSWTRRMPIAFSRPTAL